MQPLFPIFNQKEAEKVDTDRKTELDFLKIGASTKMPLPVVVEKAETVAPKLNEQESTRENATPPFGLQQQRVTARDLIAMDSESSSNEDRQVLRKHKKEKKKKDKKKKTKSQVDLKLREEVTIIHSYTL